MPRRHTLQDEVFKKILGGLTHVSTILNIRKLRTEQLLAALRERFTENALEFLNKANLLTHQKLVENNDINNVCWF